MLRIWVSFIACVAALSAACAQAGDHVDDPDAAFAGDAMTGNPDAGTPDATVACPVSDPDSDNDGVCDSVDACPGSDDAIDTDADGVADGCDVCPGGDDTLDADADGAPNDCDLCPGFDDSIDADTDGVADGCDVCPGFDDTVDTDDDTVPDGCDQCEGFDDTIDVNNNGIPDGCDGGDIIDLTPTTGVLFETDDPHWASKGYVLTASQTIDMVAFEWWLQLPSTATIAARIYSSTGVLLASGAVVTGQNTEQWYSSAVSYTLQAGQVYTISMYHSSAMTGTFDRLDDPTQPFTVAPWASSVASRSNCGAVTQADVWPDCVNTWAPYQRIVAQP